MNDTIKRTLRTFIQGFIGVLALIGVPLLSSMVQAAVGGGDIEIDLNVWQNVALAATAGGFIALIALIQNSVEDKTGKSLLK